MVASKNATYLLRMEKPQLLKLWENYSESAENHYKQEIARICLMNHVNNWSADDQVSLNIELDRIA